jgi:hypothetical protein
MTELSPPAKNANTLRVEDPSTINGFALIPAIRIPRQSTAIEPVLQLLPPILVG